MHYLTEFTRNPIVTYSYYSNSIKELNLKDLPKVAQLISGIAGI